MQAPHQHANSTPPLSKSLATGLISYAFLKNNAQIYLHIMPKIMPVLPIVPVFYTKTCKLYCFAARTFSFKRKTAPKNMLRIHSRSDFSIILLVP